MKKFTGVGYIYLILFLSLAVFIDFANGDGKIKGKIVCYGDSITSGVSFEGKGWPEQLQKLSNKITVVNEGRKGRKTSDKNDLIPVIERNLNASYFLIFLGVNDLKNGNDSLVLSCVSNMKWIINKVKENIPSAKIILMAPCQINLEEMSKLNQGKKYNLNTYNSLIALELEFKNLAKDEEIGFISLLNVVSPKNLFDGIHPNLEGYTELSDKIWQDLRTIQ